MIVTPRRFIVGCFRNRWAISLLAILAAAVAWSPICGQNTNFHSYLSDGLNQQEVAEGWLNLFDGQSKVGWRCSDWAVCSFEKKQLIISTGTGDLVRTAVQFDDFQLRFDYKMSASADCQLCFRSSPSANRGNACVVQLNGLVSDESEIWRSFAMEADAENVRFSVDGITSSDVPIKTNKTKTLRKGYIGFRVRHGQVRLRNIQLKPLKVSSIFNGEDLSGWRTDNQLDSRFTVDNGKLRMRSGWGQIETESLYADFIMSLHARTGANGLNSGVFFRCIPGQVMNGYESQIQNQFESGDRSKPVDCGTGGVFRRKNARFVNADDQAWFAKTIVADGATICVWVNGDLITDWTDQRQPAINPRKGRRLQAGSIILQGHDPTTDLQFKQILVRELNERKAK